MGGKLALMWKEDIGLDVFKFSDNQISMMATESDGFQWALTGDFNEMLSSSEKLSCRPAPPRQLDAFRAALEHCNLVDLGFIGYPFTWNNRQLGTANTKERLDKAVANQMWRSKFPRTTVTHIVSHTSDHLPLILQNHAPPKHSHRRRRGFKFEEAWLLWDGCEQGGSSALETVNKKIGGCALELQVWGASKTHPGTEEIKNLQKRIEVLNRAPPTQQNRTSKELDEWLGKQEVYWAQRSRVNWIKHGIMDLQGGWVDDMGEVARVAVEYFNNLFSIGPCTRIEECLEAYLTSFNEDDIKAALFQMGPTKGPGLDVSAILEFLNSGHMLPELNHTHIMSDFRPISLCNVIYKIIAKSAFVLGRLIIDDVFVAYEALHMIHALKLDVSKAYDRVEWSFLWRIMLKLGFPESWADRVMSCVSSTSFSVLINGQPYECFTSLLQKAELEGHIHGVSICQRAPRISHLLFANDSLLFCQATKKETKEVLDILKLYAKASGQCINMEKSLVYFSSNTSSWKRELIKAMLGVSEVARFEAYLGLPTLVGRRKYHIFSFLKDGVWKKLQGWKGKILSRVGKEILIKVVAQSIPMYTMRHVGNERKIHWLSWDKLARPKIEGGMGFKDLHQFNLAMLVKQGWSHFLEATDSPNSSYTWKRSCWRVGNGRHIWVLHDAWIPNHTTSRVLYPARNIEEEMTIYELINQELRGWDREFIWKNFHHEDAEAILRVPLSYRDIPDTVVWIGEKSGEHFVKSGYREVQKIWKELKWVESSRGALGREVWKAIWNLRVPNKIKVFSWRACRSILPTRVNLSKKRITKLETEIHALWNCGGV
ncbi:hypothetical protein RGQ29_008306 [Quercus rubra]|uniref:Reverse transcriptase domain-containing protein n=1 Tax=Quercus rubra TaxID=3512 RepID=A0AAN7DZT0_QUERU|nr:hypothetical protein RGQ29_008306 [Quercus rubra]